MLRIKPHSALVSLDACNTYLPQKREDFGAGQVGLLRHILSSFYRPQRNVPGHIPKTKFNNCFLSSSNYYIKL